jgi:hypothetical protein
MVRAPARAPAAGRRRVEPAQPGARPRPAEQPDAEAPAGRRRLEP